MQVTPLDSFRMRVYVAPTGAWLTLDAGQFQQIEVNARTGALRVGLAPATEFLHTARLRVEQPGKAAGSGNYQPTKPLPTERGAYVIPLGKGVTWVDLATK